MLTHTDVAAAAPLWVRDTLAGYTGEGHTGEGTVLHAGPQAIYLLLGRDVVAVLARDGVQVPCAARTTLPSLHDLDAGGVLPETGSRVAVADGHLLVAGSRIVIGRVVDQRAPRIEPRNAAAMAAALGPPADAAVARIRPELPVDGLQSLREGSALAADQLLGLGSGLTPLGDDVLCGWLAARVAARHACADALAAAVTANAHTRTTHLSATLLRRAVDGDVIPPFSDLVRALNAVDTPGAAPGRRAPDERALDEQVAALARVGHTSGAGLLLGLSIALDHLATRSHCP